MTARDEVIASLAVARQVREAWMRMGMSGAVGHADRRIAELEDLLRQTERPN